MRIQARIVNAKRHTLGYVVDNAEYTRYETVQLARDGYIPGVRVIRSRNTFHLMGQSRSLYSLPTRVTTPHRLRTRRS